MLAFVLFTCVLAAASALPIGGPSHAVALRVAVPGDLALLPVATASAAAGAAAAPLLLAAPRFVRWARGLAGRGAEILALTLAATAGALGHATLEPMAREMASTAVGAGLGLLATSVAIGSVGIAPAPTRRTLAGAPAAALGVALAMGALPGGSPIALGIAALAWSGLPEEDALELAALGTVPIHATAALDASRADALAGLDLPASTAMAAGALAFCVAFLALYGARRAARVTKLATFALWTATLGFALLGYAFVAAPP